MAKTVAVYMRAEEFAVILAFTPGCPVVVAGLVLVWQSNCHQCMVNPGFLQ
jgi:hypothetical protein